MLQVHSVVDDRNGVAYQEYHCIYREDVEAALRFLFAAMAPKAAEDVPSQGIPANVDNKLLESTFLIMAIPPVVAPAIARALAR